MNFVRQQPYQPHGLSPVLPEAFLHSILRFVCKSRVSVRESLVRTGVRTEFRPCCSEEELTCFVSEALEPFYSRS